MIAPLTACLFFEILVHMRNIVSAKASVKLCSATLSTGQFTYLSLEAIGNNKKSAKTDVHSLKKRKGIYVQYLPSTYTIM